MEVPTSEREPAAQDESGAQGAIAAIILAAGRASRMGEHKLLLPLAGKPLVAWSVSATSASSAHPIIVALGHSAVEVAAALPPGPYTTIVNPRFAEGMGTTLAFAVSQLPPNIAGTLILLGDQPFMPTQAIEAVLAAARARPERIVMGERGGQRGHPVYLPRRVFSQVLALTADEGARTIIAREQASVALVHLTEEHAMFDVDTLEDYQFAQALAQSAGNRPS